ncbi:hypothetical protein OUZ56_009412 [Daphnia magna]|uniref:Uncharacterized protein n=1 Tax=Daphnia magna TaxID=35525 RepID=A0ABR0AFY3_9CRUS|nr:hypothetical protein OUZ56_009412 [Daphnia magna]
MTESLQPCTVDFVLPMYDIVTRQQVSTNGFVRSKIPSRRRGADGTLSTKAEAFESSSAAKRGSPSRYCRSKDETIIQKAKIVAMKINYIINPKAIEQTLNFWKG